MIHSLLQKNPFAHQEITSRPYHARKGTAQTYRLIFTFLGGVFLFLTYMLINRAPQNFFEQIFHTSMIHKSLMVALSSALTVITLGLAIQLTPERQIGSSLIHRGKLRLKRIYEGKKPPFSLETLVHYPLYRKQTFALRHAYHSLVEKIEKDQELLHLQIERIKHDPSLSTNEKEERINEAFILLETHIDELALAFEKSS